MNGYLLDTHVWVWFQTANAEQISPEFRHLLLGWQRESFLFVSPFSAWELALLSIAKAIELGMPVQRFVDIAIADNGLRLAPLSPRILIESTQLPGEIHRDPADRILVATAREEGLTLVTRDRALLQYAKQGHLNARKV